ncbi:MAG: hypothetical protein UX68_C0002G0005 [Parcubacteria group bacterium GW2011_GWA2_46_9]|nr:MAG: hypothetical protein UX68_C0002G0005 [Parcubacteria group bacterium GW2011_GWA2_46_9]
MVECTGLENRNACKGIAGSNPAPTAWRFTTSTKILHPHKGCGANLTLSAVRRDPAYLQILEIKVRENCQIREGLRGSTPEAH